MYGVQTWTTVVLMAVFALIAEAKELVEISRREIRTDPEPLNFCHAKLWPDGSINLSHSVGMHVRKERGARMSSKDFGKTWTFSAPAGGANCFLTKDGRKRWVDYRWSTNPAKEHAVSIKTMREDGSFEVQSSCVTLPKKMALLIHREVARCKDGSLLLPCYTPDKAVPQYRGGKDPGCIAYLIKSVDDGLTWRFLSFLPRLDGAQEGMTEGSVTELADGRLIFFVRSGNAMAKVAKYPLMRYVSEDGGLTWDPGKPATDYGVDPQSGLLSDGTLFLLSGRPGVYLMLDESGTGDHFRRYDISKRMGSAYSTLLELSSGKLAIIYDDSDFSLYEGGDPNANGGKRNSIVFAEFDYK